MFLSCIMGTHSIHPTKHNMMILMRLLVLYLLLADPPTRLEHLVHEPLGAKACEIVIGEGGEALEEPSEYMFVSCISI